MAEIDEKVAKHGESIQTLKDSDKMQWAAIEKLQNRLPVWATLVFSLLTFAIGCVSTYAFMLRGRGS